MLWDYRPRTAATRTKTTKVVTEKFDTDGNVVERETTTTTEEVPFNERDYGWTYPVVTHNDTGLTSTDTVR